MDFSPHGSVHGGMFSFSSNLNWMELYLDETGSWLPDHVTNPNNVGMDCFGFGGILFEAKDIPALLLPYNAICEKWKITYPLHSNPIRMKSGTFAWLGRLDASKEQEFYRDVAFMIERQPFVAVACVIHRPGYNSRYQPIYGENRWALCKTAFAIVAERAAKFAAGKSLPLRIHFESSGKRENRKLVSYQRDLKKLGMPFSTQSVLKYNALSHEDFRRIILGDPEQHAKKSRFCQLADLVLYPMARGKYEPGYRPFQHLRDCNKLIDCVIRAEETEEKGIKYSCFGETDV